MRNHDVLRSLDQKIQARSILMHPFYLAWERGELKRDQLATYATVYYPHVAAFPRYLQSALETADDPMIRSELESNLTDELSHPKPHNELWLDFAEALGLDRELVANAPLHPAAEHITRTFHRLTRQSTAGALAALYAYESQQPEVSRRKADGLRCNYSMESPKALAYFEVHAEADIRHSEGERRALLESLDKDTSPDLVLRAAEETLDAYWGLLDGVCEAAAL